MKTVGAILREVLFLAVLVMNRLHSVCGKRTTKSWAMMLVGTGMVILEAA